MKLGKGKKSLLVASLLTAAVSTSLVTGLAQAGEHGDKEGCPHHSMMKDHGGKGGFGGHGFGGRMDPKEMMEREFTTDEIRTLTEAKLIMKGNPNLKVGKIKSTSTGYSVDIVTQDDSLVETKELAKNAMPLEMYEHMKEKMKKREEMKNMPKN